MAIRVLRDRRILLRWLFAAATVLTLGVAIQQRYRVADSLASGDLGPVNDFDRWMIMTPRFVHDHADYVDDNLPTPPLTLIAFAPFTWMSRAAAQFTWVCIKLPLACAVFLLAIGIVERSGQRLTPWALLLIVAGWWLPVVVDMQEGQVNFLALLPLVAALSVVQRDTPSSDAAAGVLIGLAAAVKVTPIIFAAYFIWKRRWIVGAAALASAAFCLIVVPAAFFGWAQNLRWMTQWTSIMIVPYVSRGTVVYASTQSVGSFVSRLLSAVPAFEIHRDGVWEYGYMNVAAFHAAGVSQITRTLMAAVATAGLVWTRRQLPTLRSQRYVVEIAAVTAFMLWFSERTWVHHYVSFVLTLAAAGMLLTDASVAERRRAVLERTLIGFFCVTLFASEAGRVFGPHGVEWAKAVGVFLWPSVLLTLAIVWAGPADDAVLGRIESDDGWQMAHERHLPLISANPTEQGRF